MADLPEALRPVDGRGCPEFAVFEGLGVAAGTYDVKSDNYNITIGFGVGKVVKTSKSVVNIFIEP